MDWEYQTNGPMDPSSPFVQSTRKLQLQAQSMKYLAPTFFVCVLPQLRAQKRYFDRFKHIEQTWTTQANHSKTKSRFLRLFQHEHQRR